jgi:hypothetical protein
LTLAHMGGLHGLAVVWPPLVLVIGLWLAARISKEEPSEEEDEEEDHRGVGGAMRSGRRIRREQSDAKRPTNLVKASERSRATRPRFLFVAPPVGSLSN